MPVSSLADKILSRAEALERHGPGRGHRLVFTNGCFDLLHRGHVEYLHAARSFGDALVVGVNSDASVRRLKGETRPLVEEEDRAVVLGALASVDGVVLFDEDTPLELIRALRPDVLVKGGDYEESGIVGADEVRRHGGEVRIVPLVEGRSTTSILERGRCR
jgi:D-beta-D-heptose 7-phosphate kinase / D-beta-D-heptose 1-phosphate adenosyltransferase